MNKEHDVDARCTHSDSVINNDSQPIDLELDASVLFDISETEEDDSRESVRSTVSLSDALSKCLRDIGKVDIRRIAKTAGVEADEAIEALRGSIFCNPETWGEDKYEGWETAEEYLYGNIRVKLNKALFENKVYRGFFSSNVEALKNILPEPTKADEIYVTLGSPWLPTEIINDFINFLIEPKKYDKCDDVTHNKKTGVWNIPNKNKYREYISDLDIYGTERMDAVQIIERTLNARSIFVYDESIGEDGESKRVLNAEESTVAANNQKKIIKAFREWIWADEKRKQLVLEAYDNKYGYQVKRRFDGSFLDFPGMAKGKTLYGYQKNAVARILFMPNTLLAHDVGAGKTFVMIAAAMELKRLKMARKNMFVVPNNLVEQWQRMIKDLYPDSEIMCIIPSDFEDKNRAQIKQKMIETDCDGILIASSCFDRIPLSKDKYILELKADCERRSKSNNEKEVEATRKRREKAKKMLDAIENDTEEARKVIYFEELGIDRLFVDEAHYYKNTSIKTSITNVLGINPEGSRKCDRMMDKVLYLQSKHGGRGVVMATGTPIANSITDIFVFQKYLQSGELELAQIANFDEWVLQYAEKRMDFEVDVITDQYRRPTRFSRFHNIKNLSNILANIADFRSVDSFLGLPEFKGYTDVEVPKTHEQVLYLESLSRRADRVREKKVSREEDNMLKITTDGRKAAIDMRLIKNHGWDVAGGNNKAFCCAERVARIYHETENDRLTQLIFCDISTPKESFNMYDEMLTCLITRGVKKGDIAFIHDARTEAEREKLFEKTRNGEIRILIGSTMKLGLGVNVQNKLVAVHHLDVPWRPADMVQRNGRILREYNSNKEIQIFRYITQGSFDAYSWQILETKQRFISEILSGETTGENVPDVSDTVLDYGEVKALALGDNRFKKRVEIFNDISRLTLLRNNRAERNMENGRKLGELTDMIIGKREEYARCLDDAQHAMQTHLHPSPYDLAWRKKFNTILPDYLKDYIGKNDESRQFEYRGFSIVFPANMEKDSPHLIISRRNRYETEIITDAKKIMDILDDVIDSLDKRAEEVNATIEMMEREKSLLEKCMASDDDYEEELEKKTCELEALDHELEEILREKKVGKE